MCVLDTKEQSVRVKKFLLALWNFAQNECALRYSVSVRPKMNRRKYTPLYEKDTIEKQNSPMETTFIVS